MRYLFKQKLNLSDLVNFKGVQKKVLIYEPQEYLAALYSHYLRLHNFDIKHCPEFGKLKTMITDFCPELLIFNVEAETKSKENPSFNFKRHFPGLLVVTIGYNLGSESLKSLMNAGVSSHINRKLSRPQDVAVVVNTLLNH